jgi:hypothetical protein
MFKILIYRVEDIIADRELEIKYMNDQYMTEEHVAKVKKECVEISKLIMETGGAKVWKPDKLLFSRESHLGRVFAQ